MKPSNQLTPYPVLASFRDDYLNAAFNTEISGTQEFGDLRIQVAFELREPYIRSLIGEGKAEYAVHIECPPSSYRAYAGINQDVYSATLDRSVVREYVEVCTFVVAKQHIAQFRSPRFHPDYADMAFDIRQGDILAVGKSTRLRVKDSEDMARRQSILSVMRGGPSQSDSMAVNTDGYKNVLISLRPDLYDIYAVLGDGDQGDVILSLVIFPALQLILTRMKESSKDPNFTDKEWYKAISEILARNSISVDDINPFDEDRSALAIAQKILSEPLEKSMHDLSASIGEE